ncbi:uncharacterized protein [Triticum aestivum]|uniref:uncharacterized protein isoform X4 n=1 Tax=Triticum aestivum TaxID=4565 RepID=UPI001D01B03F|nr:uncharacterized protein LOC123061830 isoform X4 [Triticum aestivum]
MAHLPPHSLVLLFLAVHVFLASHGSPLPPSSTYDDSICSESFRCGSVDITYPFYLSNATEATPDYTPYSCGYTDLKIFCQGEGKTAIATLQLGRDKLHNYTVQNIFYENHAIILRDTEAFISGGKCPTVTHNVTFDREWLNYTESLEELTFFFGCHSTESDQPAPDPPLDKFQIDCKGFSPPPGSGDGFSFVFSSEEGNVSREHELAEYCRQKVIAPVLQKDAVRSGLLVLPWEYGVVLGQGFELEWKQSKDRQCELCEKSYGRCAYSEKKEFLSCLCSGGICKSNPNPPSSGSNKKKNVTIAVVNMIFIKKIRCGGRCRRCIACCCCHGLSVHSQEKAEEGGELVFEAPQVQVQRLGRDPDALQGRRHGVRQLPGHGQPVQLRGARGGHRFLQREQRARRRRLRHRLQRLPWGRAGGGGEAAVQQQLPARGAVRERGGDPGPAAAPEPGHVLRVHLQGEPRAAPGLRVRPERHGGRPPARAPRGGARPAVAAPAQHRRGVRGGADLPPRHRAAHRAPRRQDQQHPPRHRLPRQGRRLRPLPPLPARRHPRLHRPPGHPRVRGPGVPPVLPADGQERRVQLRRGAGGAHLVQARRGHHPAEERDQPGRHGHQQDPEVPAGGAGGRGARLRVGPGGEEDDDHGGGAGVPVPAAERRDAPADQGGAGRAQGHPG